MPDWLSRLWYGTNKCWVMAAFSLGFSTRFEGGCNVPRQGPALLIANHQSFLDPPCVGLASPRQLCYLARKTLFKHGPFGWYLRSVNCVPVDQEGVAKEGLKTIIDLLNRGKAVLVFPEGERTLTGEIGPLKPGIQLLLRKTQAPVVPVGIAGAFDAFPRTRLLPRLAPLFLPGCRGTVAVVVGEPLDGARYAALPREKCLAELHDAIQAMKDRAEHLRRK